MISSSMTDIIYDYFASKIMFGYYMPGDRLPSTLCIRRQFQVSALTVRTVFAKLKADGYIETIERRMSKVIYQSDFQTEQMCSHSFLARKEGMYDMCRHCALLFNPIAQHYFPQQSEASLKRIRSLTKKNKGYPARQISIFYSEAMQQLNNHLALNLYWEMIRYLRIPCWQQSANFHDTEELTEKRIRQMLALIESDRSEEALEEMQTFNRDVTQKFFMDPLAALDTDSPMEQIPFQWQIYREHPQICYTLAAKIMDKIDRQIYLQDEFLPSCQALALEYGVSAMTMRRTLELLGSMRVTEAKNGLGIKVICGKNASPPDFSHLQIRKSLILFLQAMQIGALTCKNVAMHTLSSLGDKDLLKLDQEIGGLMEKQTAFLVGETCLQFIGENSPSAFIKEVYFQLYQLLLWGHALHIFFHQSKSSQIYTDYAVQLQEKLRSNDIEHFSTLLADLLLSITDFTKRLLLQLGLEEDQLIN